MPADSWACRSLYATGVRLGRHRRSGSLALAILLLLILGIEDIEAQPGRRLQMRQGIPVEEDVKIGQATVEQIEADPKQFPVLPPDQYPEAYAYLLQIVDRLLESPAMQYGDLFKYREVKIIRDDETLNAFCTAGGFIYVYTGLIKYLDTEDQLAGVMGHEIAHAEKRHVAQQMEKQQRQRLLKLGAVVASPGRGELAAIFAGINLVSQKYSRTNETESDDMSVVYISGSKHYACNGAAGFFDKLAQEGGSREPPRWLSSHPDGSSRIRGINAKAQELGCSIEPSDPAAYRAFQKSLP